MLLIYVFYRRDGNRSWTLNIVYAVDTRGHGGTPRGSAPFTIRVFAHDLYEFMNEHEIRKAHIPGFSDGANTAMIFALKYPDMVNKLILNGGNLYPAGLRFGVRLQIELGYFIAKRFDTMKRRAEMLRLMVKDPDIRPEELIAGSIPGSVLVFVKGSHFAANENPEDFNKAVLDFLAQDPLS